MCFQRSLNTLLKKKKIHNYITNKVQIFFDSDEYNSDDEILEKIQMEKNSDYEENSNKEILEKIQIKKNCDEEDSIEEDSKEEDSSEKDSSKEDSNAKN